MEVALPFFGFNLSPRGRLIPNIHPNVIRTVAEVLAAHNVTPRVAEPPAASLARAAGLSENEVERWLDALDQGYTFEQATLRAGIAPETADQPLLAALARAISTAAGQAENAMAANRQQGPLKDQGDKLVP